MQNQMKFINHKGHKNVKIIAISTLIGVVAGLVSVLYRVMLSYAEEFSFSVYSFVADNSKYIPLLFIGLAAMGYFVGLLIKHKPLISGSGIPQVKARMMGYLSGSWFGTLVAKFVGGCMAIVGGLSLGREGPSIQLGALVAEGISEKCTTDRTERRVYIASGASAGLAAAFNAPLAGVMFALEEIFRYFSPMVLLSTMVAAIVADFVSKLFFGIGNVFDFTITQSIPIQYYWIFLVLGVILGLSGVFYNKCIIQSQKIYRKMSKLPTPVKIMIPFMLAGILGLTFPIVLGGGHAVLEELHISTSLLILVAALVIKFIFSMVSFGSGAPGGIFFPLLVLGSLLGAIFAKIVIPMFDLDEVLFYNFVIIAMAGYFTAIVRAPLTGIILLVEMTGTLSQLLPLIITSAIAYIVAEELGNKPIYDSLMESLLKSRGLEEEPVDQTKILVETIVQMGCPIEGKKLMDITLPKKCLVVSIKRGEEDITPNGNTVVKGGDYLLVIVSVAKERMLRDSLEELCSHK